MKYLLYCRKSSDSEDRQVLSLESQENELKRIAEASGLQIVDILHESMSAKSEGRPVFNRMLKMLAQSKAEGILCWKLDRLARNFIDGGKIIDLLQKSSIREIRTYESIHLPTDNVLMLAVHFGMANQYIRDLSVNVKRGNRAKLERGEWPNHPPMGYINDKATKLVIVDPTTSRYIVRAFELYSTGGYGIETLVEKLYEEGLRTKAGGKVASANVHRILTRSFYTGVMERDGRFYEGKHQPLISKSLYDKVQMVMSGNAHPRPQKHFFPLRGFLKCASCGCALTSTLKKGHQYYYCTNGKGTCTQHQTYLRETKIYEMVAEALGDLHFSEAKIEMMYQAAKEKLEREGGEERQTINTLQKLLNSLLEKESKLLDAFLGEQISKELYEKKVSAIQHERIELNKQLRAAENGRGLDTLEPTKKVFIEANKAQKDFIEAGEEKKRIIVEKLLWNLSIENQTVASVQYKSEYFPIAKADKNASIFQLLGDRESNPN